MGERTELLGSMKMGHSSRVVDCVADGFLFVCCIVCSCSLFRSCRAVAVGGAIWHRQCRDACVCEPLERINHITLWIYDDLNGYARVRTLNAEWLNGGRHRTAYGARAVGRGSPGWMDGCGVHACAVYCETWLEWKAFLNL